jgi:hypothetical protein
MPQGWSSQDGDDFSDIGAWMARRSAQLALQPEADAFARNLWNQATQGGGDLYAGNPSDLTALGLAALGEARSDPTAAANNDDQVGGGGIVDAGAPRDSINAVSGSDHGRPYFATDAGSSQQGFSPPRNPYPDPSSFLPSEANVPSVSQLDVIGPRPIPAPHPGLLDSLNHNLGVRALAGTAAYTVGLPLGVGRGALHAVEGVGQGLNFAASLLSPGGREAARDEAAAAAHSALQYGRSVMADPSRLGSDLTAQGTSAIHNLVPFTTPMADTALGEMGHDFGIGMNAGETAANVAGLVAAPELADGLIAARSFAATREANVAKMMGQGVDEQTARYLSKSYDGQGDHALIPRRQASIKIPQLGEVAIPDWIMNSPLNVSKPRGMSQGDFYEYHYAVDPRFYGARLPSDLNGGKGWSGRRLGLERYSGVQRAWARTPTFWKDTATGLALSDALNSLPPDYLDDPK